MNDVNARIDPDNQPTIFTLGLGAVLTAHTDYGGMPGIILCPARKPGVVGSASTEVKEGDVISTDAVVIRFATVEAALAHIELVKDSVEAFEKGLKK